MFRTARKTFPLVAIAALAYSSWASAAIFEINPPIGASKAEIRPGSGGEGPYQMLRIGNADTHAFPSLKIRTAISEELLWMEIGDTDLIGLRVASSNGDSTPYSSPPMGTSRNAAQAGSVSSREDTTAPEIWMVILIGAGLIWSHLRRKARHHSIRFSGS